MVGVYSVTWDAQQNIFKISGEVDPNVLLKAVLCTGEHAELVTVKLNHPQLRHRNYNNYGSYGPTTGHHVPPYRHGYRSLPEQPYYGTNNPNPYIMPPEPTPVAYPSADDRQTPLPHAIHVLSYPYHEYGPNDNVDRSSYCSIM